MIPKSEQQLMQQLVQHFWHLVNVVVPGAAEDEIEARSQQGYDEVPFWHTYTFPDGVLAQASHKLERMKATCRAHVPQQLIEDEELWDTLWDNAIGLVNYAKMFAALLAFLREQEEAYDEGAPHMPP